jgi:hypothetical protein
VKEIESESFSGELKTKKAKTERQINRCRYCLLQCDGEKQFYSLLSAACIVVCSSFGNKIKGNFTIKHIKGTATLFNYLQQTLNRLFSLFSESQMV